MLILSLSKDQSYSLPFSRFRTSDLGYQTISDFRLPTADIRHCIMFLGIKKAGIELFFVVAKNIRFRRKADIFAPSCLGTIVAAEPFHSFCKEKISEECHCEDEVSQGNLLISCFVKKQKCPGDVLSSRQVAPQLLSALIRFTIQFGMGWSGSVSLKSPRHFCFQVLLETSSLISNL